MRSINQILFLRAIISLLLAITANLNTFVLFSYAKTFSSSTHNKSVPQVKPLTNSAKVITKQNRNGSPVECMSQDVQSLGVNFNVSSLSITSKVVKHLTLDVNNDKYLDLIILSDKGVIVFPGSQNGVFSKPKIISSDTYLDVLSSDLNNDGLSDIVCVSDDSLQLFLHSGDFNFSKNKTLNADTLIKTVLISDFNNDLFNDFIVFSDAKDGLLILNSKSEDLFLSPSKLTFKNTCLNAISSDLNGDGNIDLAIVSNDADEVWIYYGDGKGTFPKEKSLSVIGPKNILDADFNNDNKADLVISSSDEEAHKVLLFSSEGDDFSSSISFPIPNSSNFINVGYLNNDCYLDILSVNSNNTFSIIRNSGNNTFLPSIEFNLSSNPNAVSVKDLNGDVKDDIVFSFEDSIQINLQSPLEAGTEITSDISKPVCMGGRPGCDKEGYVLNCPSNNVGCDKNGKPTCYEFKEGLLVESGYPKCEIKPTSTLVNRSRAALKYRIDPNAPYCEDGAGICPSGVDFVCPEGSIPICSTMNNMSEPLCFDFVTGMLSFGMCDSVVNPQLYRCVDGTASCIGGGSFTCEDGFPICSTMNNNSEPICFTLADGRLSMGSCTSSGLACFPNQKACNGVCIANNACCNNSECSSGRVCQSGVCGCLPTHKLCNDICILNSSCCNDPNDCTGGQVCSGLGGSCSCPNGQKLCNGSCIPFDSCCNAPNSCTSGQVCSGLGGSCNCPGGQRLCNGSCLPVPNGLFCEDLNSIDEDECSNRCRCEDAILKSESLPFTYDYYQRNSIFSPINNKYYIFNYNAINEYDPDLKSFTSIPNSVVSSFDFHNGVYNLDNNKIYFVGANDRNVFVFDPVTKVVSMITATGGSLSFVNYDFCSVYHERRKSIFSLGGKTGNFPANLNYEYLVANNVITDKVAGNQDSLPVPLVRPSCVYNPLNGTVIIFGGYKDTGLTQPNTSIFTYNPDYNTNNPLPKFSEQRDLIQGEVLAGVYNKSSNRVQVYLKNGSILEFNPVTNSINSRPITLPLSTLASNGAIAINSNENRTLLFGGGTKKIIQHRNSCNNSSSGGICPSDKKICNGSCIPIDNCCNFPNSCTSGQLCLNGSCSCQAGQKLCNGNCILSTACCENSECSSGKLCINGSCSCLSDQKVCKGVCIPNNSCCTTAPTGCNIGQVCPHDGATCSCPTGQKPCNNSCIPNDNCCDDSQCSSGSICRGTCVFVPKLLSIEPPVELPGATIMLIGENFLNNITGVSFFTNMVGFNIVSNREISVTVPPQSGSQSTTVSISGPNVVANNSSLPFTYLGVPFITSTSPSTGQIGDKIKLFGSNFIKTSSVKFNTTPATFMINSNTEIEADVPSGAGSVNVSVTNPKGTSNLASFTYTPKPVLSSLSKISGIVGETISINGSNFIMVSDVKFQTVQAMFNVISESKIDVEVPAGVSGSANVTVTTPSGTSDPLSFTYRAPQIISISPNVSILPGSMININGSAFTNATTVKLSGVDTTFLLLDDSSLSVTIPSNVQGILFAQVTTPSGSSNTSQISVIGTPSINQINPLKSEIGSTVSISGTNLKSATSVMFGDVSATFSTPTDDTSLVAVVPPGSGMVQVSVTNPVGTSVENAYSTFTYPGLPVLISLMPTTGYKDDIVSIMGSEFYGAISVMFGDILPAQVVPVSNAQVNIKIPSGFGQKDISVQTLAGTSNILQFTYDNPGAHICAMSTSGFITSNGGCKQIDTNRAWDTKHPRLLNYADANDFCENRVVNGFDDWRLPTREEIQLLSVYPGQIPPASLAFNFTTNNNFFWTTSMYLNYQSRVQFNPTFGEQGIDTSSLNSTICVRATCNPDQRICGNQCISNTACCSTDSLNACTGGKVCNGAGTCSCPFGTSLCPSRDVCISSGGCCTDANCTSGTPICNTSTNTCIQCTASNTSSCTSGRVCDLNSTSSNLNKCVCPNGQFFCSISNSCINSSGCCTDANCTSGQICVSNSCSCPSGKIFCSNTNTCINSSGSGANASVCCTNSDCLGGGICMNNACTSGVYCIDSDGGNAPEVKGSITTATLSSSDFCTLGSVSATSCVGLNCKLREYICSGALLSSAIYSCDNCQDGMCVGSSFEIMSNPALAPQITSLNPQSALASGGGTVTITGNNLAYVTSAYFGGISATILFKTDNEVRVSLPSILSNINTLNYPVSVRSPASSGQEFISNELNFSYYLLPPSLTSIFPNQIYCNSTNSVNISGNNFYNITNVSFVFDNGQEFQAASFMVDSPNVISAFLPTSRPSGCPISSKVKVTNSFGSSDVNNLNALLSFVPIVISSSSSGISSSGIPQVSCDNGDIKCPSGYAVKCKIANPNPTCMDTVLLGYNVPGCCGQNSCYGLGSDFAPRCFPINSSSSGSVQGLACPSGFVIPTCYGNVNNVLCPPGFMSGCFGDPVKNPSCCNADYCFSVNEPNGPQCFFPTSTSSSSSSSGGLQTSSSSGGTVSSSGSSRSSICSLGMVLCSDGNPVTCLDSSLVTTCINGYSDCCKLNSARTGLLCFPDKLSCPRSVPFMCSNGQLACGNICCNTGCCGSDPSICLENPSCSMTVSSSGSTSSTGSSSGSTSSTGSSSGIIVDNGIHLCRFENDQVMTQNGGCQDLTTGLVWSLPGMGDYFTARNNCNDLTAGGYDDWRLPRYEDVTDVVSRNIPTNYFTFVSNVANLNETTLMTRLNNFFWSPASQLPIKAVNLSTNAEQGFDPYVHDLLSHICVRGVGNTPSNEMVLPLPATVPCCTKYDFEYRAPRSAGDIRTLINGSALDGDIVYDTDKKKIYLISSYGFIQIYDPINNTSRVSMAILPRGKGDSPAVYDFLRDKVYIFGGSKEDENGIYRSDDSILEYDTATDTITEAGKFPYPIKLTNAVWDPIRHVAYIFGGVKVESSREFSLDTIFKFDPSKTASERLTQIGTLPYPLGGVPLPGVIHSAHDVFWDTQLNVAYIFGGKNHSGDLTRFIEDILIFNPNNNSISKHSLKLPSGTRSVNAAWDNSQNIAYLYVDIDQTPFIFTFNPSTNEFLSQTLTEAERDKLVQMPSSRSVYIQDLKKILNYNYYYHGLSVFTPCYRACNFVKKHRVDSLLNNAFSDKLVWVNDLKKFYGFRYSYDPYKFNSVNLSAPGFDVSDFTPGKPVYSLNTKKIYFIGTTPILSGGSVSSAYRLRVISFDPFNNTYQNLINNQVTYSLAYSSSVYDTANGNIYIFGGANPVLSSNSESNKIIEYNPSTNTITEKSEKLPFPRQLTTSLWDTVTNKIYVVGGYSYNIPTETGTRREGRVDEIVEYNPEVGSVNPFMLFFHIPEVSIPSFPHYIIRNGKLLLLGFGDTIYQLDLATKKLEATNSEEHIGGTIRENGYITPVFNDSITPSRILYASEIDRLFVQQGPNFEVTEYGFGQCLDMVNNPANLSCALENLNLLMGINSGCTQPNHSCGSGLNCCNSCCLTNPNICSDDVRCSQSSSGTCIGLIQCGNQCCLNGCCPGHPSICANNVLCVGSVYSCRSGESHCGVNCCSMGCCSTNSNICSDSLLCLPAGSSSGGVASSSSSGAISYQCIPSQFATSATASSTLDNTTNYIAAKATGIPNSGCYSYSNGWAPASTSNEEHITLVYDTPTLLDSVKISLCGSVSNFINKVYLYGVGNETIKVLNKNVDFISADSCVNNKREVVINFTKTTTPVKSVVIYTQHSGNECIDAVELACGNGTSSSSSGSTNSSSSTSSSSSGVVTTSSSGGIVSSSSGTISSSSSSGSTNSTGSSSGNCLMAQCSSGKIPGCTGGLPYPDCTYNRCCAVPDCSVGGASAVGCINPPSTTSSSSGGGLQTSSSSGLSSSSSSSGSITSPSSSSSGSSSFSGYACKLNDSEFLSAEGGCKQISAGLVWSDRSVGNYSDAQAFCTNKNMRLPTANELINVAGNSKAVTHFFPGFNLTTSNKFWASSTLNTKSVIELVNGVAQGANDFNLNNIICVKESTALPEITNLEPVIKGAPGDILTLVGSNLLNVNKINFGSTLVNVIPSTNNSLNVNVPEGVGQATISATSNSGTSTNRSFVFLPVIKGVSAIVAGSSIKTDYFSGQPNDIINLHGLGFYSGRSLVKKVRFIDRNNFSTDLVIEGVAYGNPFDTVSVRVPSLQNQVGGKFIVETDYGVSPLSNVQFDFIPSPEITYLPPYAMVGESVTIIGMNFTGATSAKFNGYPTQFTLNTDSSISVIVPSIPSTDLPVDVVITTPSGSNPLNNNSKFIYPPVISSINPPFGNLSTEFNISGINFSMINNCFLKFTSSGSCVMSTPAVIFSDLIISMLQGMGNGELSVICDGNIESNKILFSFVPEFTSISPALVSVGDEITIRGNNLENVSGVQYGRNSVFNDISFMLTLPVPNDVSPTCDLNVSADLQSPTCLNGIADCPSGKGVPTCFAGDAKPRCKLVAQPIYSSPICPQGFGVAPCMQGDVIYNCQNNHDSSIGAYSPSCVSGIMLTCVNGYPLCVNQAFSQTLSDEVFCRNSESKITINAPLASGVQNLQAIFNGIAYPSLLTFSYLPQITSLSANTGLPGDMITIRGNNLAGFTMVTFTDSTNNPNISLLANATFAGEELTVTVPTVPETLPERLFDGKNVNILISNSFGVSSRNIASKFTYSAPVISSISPSVNVRPGDLLNIMGIGFNNVNGINLGTFYTNTFARASDNEIQVNFPSSISDPTVNCSLNSKQNTSSNLFSILAAQPPIIASVVQANNSLVIMGSNFSGATSVAFGNTVNGYAGASSFSATSSGSIINATLPTAPIVPPNGKIRVTTPNGTSFSNAASPSLVTNSPYCSNNVVSCANSFPMCQTGFSLICGSGVAYCCNSTTTSCYNYLNSLGPKCVKYIFNY